MQLEDDGAVVLAWMGLWCMAAKEKAGFWARGVPVAVVEGSQAGVGRNPASLCEETKTQATWKLVGVGHGLQVARSGRWAEDQGAPVVCQVGVS